MKDLLYPFTTMAFASPGALLVPLLLLSIHWLRRRPVTSAAPTGSLARFERVRPSLRVRLRGPILGLLSAIFIVTLAAAAARPQRLTIITDEIEARNLVLALDLSRSMGADDFESGFGRGQVNRLEAVKLVVGEFLRARAGDRIGVVVFGSEAFVQAPLTRDHGVLEQLVRQLQLGLAGDGTAIGDGLGLALKRVEEVPAPAKAVVLLTDGVSNSGQVHPLAAAKVAADLGVRVYTIGIGSTAPVVIEGPGGPLARPPPRVEFDEATLEEIARRTGGKYLNARDLEGLREVYREIDRLERTSAAEPERQVVEELFPVWLAVAAISYLLWTILSRSLLRRVP